MHPESEYPHSINPISTPELASPIQKTRATMSLESQDRFESDMVSSYSQGIASSPSFGGSEDSVPALNPSGSPSPRSRRVSLLSNASIVDSVPATPTSHLIEDARVDNDSDASPRYHRIHSTPYPKLRLPLQLTPHPQARVVSLPEWTRNRDPFLEAMRNLRSVSSPARFKRPPLSPLSAEEESFELSGSSQSAASAVSFPALPEQSVERSILSERMSSLSVPREQFYTAPEGFFLTPPSFKSMVLSPATTGPERSLPQDRPLPPIFEDDSTCPFEPNSEDEVSLMLQRATLDTSSYYNRSSVSFSSTSRSSSPESVVFLSSIARIPRSFLGGKTQPEPILETTSSQESHDDTTHDSAAHDDGDDSQEHPSTEIHLERPKISSLQQCTSGHAIAQEEAETDVNNGEELSSPSVPSSAVHHDSDWILFDHPRPIPALHGPPSLPYARCPSGAEGVVLDDQHGLDGVIWGLSGKDPRSRRPDEHKHTEASNTEQFVLATKDVRPSRAAVRESKKAESIDTSLVPEARSLTGTYSHRPLSTIAEHTSNSSPNSKEKHVRFVDNANGSKLPSQGHHAPTPNADWISTNSTSEPNPPADLTRILLDQVERARTIEPQPLQQAIPPASRKQILDQLRRFGVPFRPHGLPTPPSTASPRFVSQFPPPDPFLAPGQTTQHVGLRPLTYMNELSMPKTFTQAAMQDRTAVVLKPRDSDGPTCATNSAPSTLSNIKSIPLLKLRQRQHAGMDSWRKDERPFGEVPLSTPSVQTEATHNVNQPSTKTHQPHSTLCQAANTSTTTPAPGNTASANANETSSPKNRRQHRSSKRAPQEVAPAESGSRSKENHQASGPKGNTDGRKAPRQTGRKRNQRTRTDSLPQGASRT
ncbi:unnamed protein product [Rhizoctonia solani]|uniref:Uncharacterized protein n=1 Tax=Rhizoctonia solani TaxID=456999 RepID=A0A8H3DEW4_9AGAM|nr:unnamed protein product [Rhizoctonia solani]